MTDNKRILFIEINPLGQGACPLLDMSYDLAPVCTLTNREAHCKECRKGMTRAEAVERMAVKMCQHANRITKCEDCITAAKGECELKGYYPLAEAAFDALITTK